MAYLDTTILGSYYCPETLSDKVNQAMSRLDQALISPLVELEFCSLLSMKVRIRQMAQAAAASALAQFRGHLADGLYTMADIGPREYEIAGTWISGFNTSLRTLDALHLACAFANGQTLWTTDKPLAQAARRLAIPHKLLIL